MLTPDQINRAADDLRDWFHNESGVTNSFDAVRVLALVLGDFVSDMGAALDRASVDV